MIRRERQDAILKVIRQRRYCTVNYLSQQLFVAPITIRRDLTEMETAGLVVRCYGGATIPEYENREVPFEIRSKHNAAVKEMLAKKAAELISEGDVVFLDASSTVSHIIKFLSEEQNLTIITNSTLIAEKLKEKHILCYLTGGRAVENSYALVGSIAEKTVSELYANIFFFSAQGIDADGMISDQSELESSLRRLMLKNSKKRYFLFDGSKYDKRFAFQICTLQELSGTITDLTELPFRQENP